MTKGATSDAIFHYYIDRGRLVPEGDPIVTRTSRLLPVRWQGVAAILKVAVEPEEEVGNELMAWWDGQGVPVVLAREGKAILLERAQNEGSLADLVRDGRDDEATRIICGVVEKLHLPKTQPIPTLVPLSEWFGELASAAETYGGFLSLSAATARDLLAAPREITVLHGDIHHDNILNFGERGFDYANLFSNPDHATATDPAHFGPRVGACDGDGAFRPQPSTPLDSRMERVIGSLEDK
jgi:streptomycin 6-kinase